MQKWVDQAVEIFVKGKISSQWRHKSDFVFVVNVIRNKLVTKTHKQGFE